jgi:phosphoenolpyruvate carboxylase
VLFVFALLRWAGEWENNVEMDIIPLFETMDGMNNSRSIMESLFSIPAYKDYVQHRTQTQTMMLGFSDGTKDGGYLQANWNIFKTKEALTSVCEAHGIRSVFFDGRGGPPARGGGKTHRFYAAQSDRISNNEIQITIQGQTITSTYGTQEQFNYNCRQMLAAGLSNAIYGKKNQIADSHRILMEELAQSSFEKYTALKNHPKFISYLEEKSTLKYYSKANIGSRPAKRGADKKLTLEDLRAISFVGSWSQLKQNVPGYFGIGTALSKMEASGRLEEFKELFQQVPIFRALILNSMMALAKTNFSLTRYMSNDPEYGAFWNILHEEFELTKRMVLEISGYERLMQEETLSRMSVEARESIVLPLLVIQQYGLIQIQKSDEFKDSYEKLVTRSLYGNINASRNSA